MQALYAAVHVRTMEHIGNTGWSCWKENGPKAHRVCSAREKLEFRAPSYRGWNAVMTVCNGEPISIVTTKGSDSGIQYWTG